MDLFTVQMHNGPNEFPQDADLIANELLGVLQLHLQDYDELLVLIQAQRACAIDYDSEGLISSIDGIKLWMEGICANRQVLYQTRDRLIDFYGAQQDHQVRQAIKVLPEKYQSILMVLIEAIDQKVGECTAAIKESDLLFERSLNYLENF